MQNTPDTIKSFEETTPRERETSIPQELRALDDEPRSPEKRSRAIKRKYSLTEERMVNGVFEKVGTYDLLSVEKLYPGDSDERGYADVFRMLDIVFNSEMTFEEKKQVLRNELGISIA